MLWRLRSRTVSLAGAVFADLSVPATKLRPELVRAYRSRRGVRPDRQQMTTGDVAAPPSRFVSFLTTSAARASDHFENQPVTSASRWVSTFAYTQMSPPADSGAMTAFGTVCRAVKFRFEAKGRVPHG